MFFRCKLYVFCVIKSQFIRHLSVCWSSWFSGCRRKFIYFHWHDDSLRNWNGCKTKAKLAYKVALILCLFVAERSYCSCCHLLQLFWLFSLDIPAILRRYENCLMFSSSFVTFKVYLTLVHKGHLYTANFKILSSCGYNTYWHSKYMMIMMLMIIIIILIIFTAYRHHFWRRC